MKRASPRPARRGDWLAEAPRRGSVLVDGTPAAGAMPRRWHGRVGPTGRIIGLDRDPAMLALAREAAADLPVTLVHAHIPRWAGCWRNWGFDRVNGVLLDLGLSSDQLAWERRGFSFTAEGPLDMRFDPDAGGPTAANAPTGEQALGRGAGPADL